VIHKRYRDGVRRILRRELVDKSNLRNLDEKRKSSQIHNTALKKGNHVVAVSCG
jgi:hypothetical protein